MEKRTIDLGFAEPVDEKWRLMSQYFPSKIGGYPAWLSLSSLPDCLSCSGCKQQCKFLLQVYSPEETKTEAFHRTLFIFVCSTTGCEQRTFKCFRSQLPRINKFYSATPPDENYFDPDAKHPSAEKHRVLCCICGISGGKYCSQCKKLSYCSKEHQTYHWKKGHKEMCKELAAQEGDKQIKPDGSVPFAFPEYEIVIEPEKSAEEQTKIRKEKAEAQMKAYMDRTKASSDELNSVSDQEWNKQTTVISDQQFLTFIETIDTDPDQIIRYDKGGTPLLVNQVKINIGDIPNCARCSTERTFEFQVMPQTLSYLKIKESATENTLDWGTLLVYTCRNSCDLMLESGDSEYSEEFIHRQMFSDDDVVKVK